MYDELGVILSAGDSPILSFCREQIYSRVTSPVIHTHLAVMVTILRNGHS